MKKKEKKEKMSVRQIMKNTGYILKYLFSLDKKICIVFFSVFCLMSIISAIIDTYFFKMVIDCLTGDATLSTTIWAILLNAAGAIAVNILRAFIEQWMEIQVIASTGKIQRRLIKKCSEIDLMCYDRPEYYEDFILAAQNSEKMLRQALVSTTYIIGNAMAIATVAGLIISVDPIVAIFPITGFVINIITRFAITKLEFNYNMEQQKIRRKADYSKRVFYQPEYAKELKLSDIGTPLRKQFLEAIEEEKKMGKKYGVKIAILSLINWILVFTVLSYFLLPAYLGYLAIIKGSILLGDVAAMTNAADKIRNRLDATNYALVEFQQVGQYADKFRRFIDYKTNIEVTEGTEKVPDGPQPIEIRNMSFRYDGCTEDVLKDVNITITPGEKIAIVGENGAGKTTFVKLLMRLYDVTGGGIYYGGINIKNFNIKEYREKIGAVFQDYQIYASTLGENIKMNYFKDEDREDAEKALALADFSNKLEKLKKNNNGLDTEMTREFSEVGTILSGGESQKVAISRMFVKGGGLSVAILDEPSSALDPMAEYTLNNNMMKNAENSSVIFISHRLSTTRSADVIYMFEHGQIIEQGTHDELVALGGEYAEMFEKQAHYYKLKEAI